VAISVAWQTVVTVTSQAALYTVPSATSATYGYARDLVITNSGANTVYIAMNSNTPAATTTGSFAIPTGGTLVLTQCQVTNGAVVNGTCPTAAGSSVSIGYATNVAYI
jgi:hypothetical protein